MWESDARNGKNNVSANAQLEHQHPELRAKGFHFSLLHFILTLLQIISVTCEQQLLDRITQGNCLISFSTANTFHPLLDLVQQFYMEESVL